MGEVYKYIMGVAAVMCIMYLAFSLFNDANLANGGVYTNDFSSFDKMQKYGSYFQNQTDDMKEKLTSPTTAPQDENTAATLLNLLLQGANITVTGLIGFLDVGISLIYDSMGYLGIPPFYVTMVIIVLIIGVLSGVYSALRGGPI